MNILQAATFCNFQMFYFETDLPLHISGYTQTFSMDHQLFHALEMTDYLETAINLARGDTLALLSDKVSPLTV